MCFQFQCRLEDQEQQCMRIQEQRMIGWQQKNRNGLEKCFVEVEGRAVNRCIAQIQSPAKDKSWWGMMEDIPTEDLIVQEVTPLDPFWR